MTDLQKRATQVLNMLADAGDTDAKLQVIESALRAERERGEKAGSLGYVLVKPWEKVVVHGEGADEEYQLVPASRQAVYEGAIDELKAKLAKYER